MITDEEVVRRAGAMRRLPEDARTEAIAAASNVFGFERFAQRARQVALRESYRRPGDNP